MATLVKEKLTSNLKQEQGRARFVRVKPQHSTTSARVGKRVVASKSVKVGKGTPVTVLFDAIEDLKKQNIDLSYIGK